MGDEGSKQTGYFLQHAYMHYTYLPGYEAFGSRQWAEVPGEPETVHVDVLVDTCSIEVFAAGGLVTISDLVFF